MVPTLPVPYSVDLRVGHMPHIRRHDRGLHLALCYCCHVLSTASASIVVTLPPHPVTPSMAYELVQEAVQKARKVRNPASENGGNKSVCGHVDSCRFIVSMVCHQTYAETNYHNIVDCLLPQIDSIRLIDALAAEDSSYPLCVLGSLKSYARFVPTLIGVSHETMQLENGNLRWSIQRPWHPHLQPGYHGVISGTTNVTFLNEHRHRPCLDVPEITVQATKNPPAAPPLLHQISSLHDMVRRSYGHWCTKTHRQGASGHEANASRQAVACLPSAEGHRHVLLIQRAETRQFRSPDFERLHQALAGASSRQVRIYHGNESDRETVALFAAAAFSVGWHGAAMANLAFTPHRLCSVELSTFVDLNGSLPWRCNTCPPWSRVTPIGERLYNSSFHVHHLPIESVIYANAENASLPGGRMCDRHGCVTDWADWHLQLATLSRYQDPGRSSKILDIALKHMRLVPLSSETIASVANLFARCQSVNVTSGAPAEMEANQTGSYLLG